MGFPGQEYWSGLPFPNPRIEPESFASPALADEFFTPAPPGEPQKKRRRKLNWGHFPSGPVAETPCFQCRGSGFALWSENSIPHAATKSLHAATKGLMCHN